MLQIKSKMKLYNRIIILSTLIMATWGLSATTNFAYADGERVCVIDGGTKYIRINIGEKNQTRCETAWKAINDEELKDSRRSGIYTSCEGYARDFAKWEGIDACAGMPIFEMSDRNNRITTADYRAVVKYSKDSDITQLTADRLAVSTNFNYSFSLSEGQSTTNQGGANLNIGVLTIRGTRAIGTTTGTTTGTAVGYSFDAGLIPGVQMVFPVNDPSGFTFIRESDLLSVTVPWVKEFSHDDVDEQILGGATDYFSPIPGGLKFVDTYLNFYSTIDINGGSSYANVDYHLNGTTSAIHYFLQKGVGKADAENAIKNADAKYKPIIKNTVRVPVRVTQGGIDYIAMGKVRKIANNPNVWRDGNDPITWNVMIHAQRRSL